MGGRSLQIKSTMRKHSPSVLEPLLYLHFYGYQVTFCSSGTKTFLAFLIMGWGFRSSSANLCFRGLKSSPPGTLERTRSAGSGLKFTSTSTQLGSMGLGVSLSFSREDSERHRSRGPEAAHWTVKIHITHRHLLESQCCTAAATWRKENPHQRQPRSQMGTHDSTQQHKHGKNAFLYGQNAQKETEALGKDKIFRLFLPPRNVKQTLNRYTPLTSCGFKLSSKKKQLNLSLNYNGLGTQTE